MRAPILTLLLFLVALVVVIACGCSAPAPEVTELAGGGHGVVMTVDGVIDGDTIEAHARGTGAERVRLLGIDTPETVKPDAPVDCFGPEASARTKALLPPGTQVVVQRDEEARDRYGRLLAYVWRRADALFVNRDLVAGGYARTLSIEPNTAHRADLSAARAAAQQRGAGLWGRCEGRQVGR